jgi:PAS domain S-box-containing protein
MATEEQDSYEHLRDWYLARLRRQALPTPAAARLTPSRLVKADAEIVRQLITGKLKHSAGAGLVSTADKSVLARLSVGAIGWLIGLFLLLPCFVLLCVSLAFAGDPESGLLFQALIIGAIVLVALVAVTLGLLLYKIGAESQSLQLTVSKTLGGEVTLPAAAIRNELVWLSGAMHDLTRAYTSARERERAIADYASSLICSFDQEAKFVAVSPACVWILEYTKDQLVGTSMPHLVVPEDLPKTLRAFEIAKTDRYSKFENSMRSANGKIIHMDWDIQWSESRSEFYGTARDITELKKLEKLKQEFMAMLTHDMRSPLSNILSNTKLLLCGALGELGEEPMKRLKSVERTGNRLLILVNELLDIDRLEGGNLELDLKEVPVSHIVESAKESVEALADGKTMRIEVESIDCNIVADETRLINVVINLLGNAIKFSPTGSVIRIEVTSDIEHGTLEFRVTDQGRGIAKKDLNKIFDRFRQVEIEDATLKGGSGLGLAICKAVVESHNGIIGVESEYGIGSTFWFRVPVKQPISKNVEASGSN